MERIFQISAVILAGVAAIFLWRGNADGAFISGVFGAVSFFLSIRTQVKERNRQRELAAEKNYGQLMDDSLDEPEIFTDENKNSTENRI
jgi:hypothetical protein